MKFKINNEEWTIKEVEQDEFWRYNNKERTSDDGYYQGTTHFNRTEIWLDNLLSKDKKKKTLYHELMHCYISTHISLYDFNITEELLCDISANSHDLIHKIVEDYFKKER